MQGINSVSYVYTGVCAVVCLGHCTFSCSSNLAACVTLVTPTDSPVSLADFWPKCTRTDFSTRVVEMGPCQAHESCSGDGVQPTLLSCCWAVPQCLLLASWGRESGGLSSSALPSILSPDSGKQLRCYFLERNVRNTGCFNLEEHLRREMRKVFPKLLLNKEKCDLFWGTWWVGHGVVECEGFQLFLLFSCMARGGSFELPGQPKTVSEVISFHCATFI